MTKKPWLADAWSLAGVGILALFLHLPLLLGQKVVFWGLPALQFYPWRFLALQELREGRLPLWNPYNGGGAPLLANYQTAFFYPPNLLALVLNPAYTLGLLGVAHVLLAGVGMWLLLGRLGGQALGRGVGALAFAFGGYLTARFWSIPTMNAVAWMPWLFWAVLNTLEGRQGRQIAWLALVSAALLLVGHAQTAFYALVGAALFTLWGAFFWLQGAARPQRWQALARVGGGVALGVLMSAVQLLLTLEYLQQSARSEGLPYAELTNFSFAPLRLLTLLMPNFFGSPVDGSYLTPGRGAYFEDAIYFGVVPFVAALASLTAWVQWRPLLLEARKGLRSVPFWLGLALFGFALALGGNAPWYRWLYDYVPTFDSFRDPVRWLVWTSFAGAVLAGLGVDYWRLTPRTQFWSRLLGVGALGLVLLNVAALVFIDSEEAFLPVLSRALALLGVLTAGACALTLLQPTIMLGWRYRLWQAAVLAWVALDLGVAARGLNPTVPDSFYRPVSVPDIQGRLYWFADYEEALKFGRYFDLADYRKAQRDYPSLRAALLPNLNLVDGVATLNNFDPLQPAYHRAYLDLIESQGARAERLLQAAGVGQTYGRVRPLGWERVAGETPTYRAPQAPPLVWLVGTAQWAEEDEAISAALLNRAWRPEASVILAGTAPPELADAPPLRAVSFFEVVRDAPNHKTYRVVTEGAGWLVLAQTYYVGWQASLDGKKQPLYRANLSFMAVHVPEGGGEIQIRYAPPHLAWGMLLSLSGFLLTLGVGAWSAFFRPEGLGGFFFEQKAPV